MAKLLDLSVYGPGHISNILQVDASVYAKAFVTDGGKDTQVVRGDGTLASISSLYVGNAATATNAPWSGITGKPTTFTPSAHTHYSIVTEGDNRSVATIPTDYGNSFVFRGLKDNDVIGSPSSVTYSYLIGLRGWSDSSGGDAHELAFNNSGIFRRQGSTTEWSS